MDEIVVQFHSNQHIIELSEPSEKQIHWGTIYKGHFNIAD